MVISCIYGNNIEIIDLFTINYILIRIYICTYILACYIDTNYEARTHIFNSYWHISINIWILIVYPTVDINVKVPSFYFNGA